MSRAPSFLAILFLLIGAFLAQTLLYILPWPFGFFLYFVGLVLAEGLTAGLTVIISLTLSTLFLIYTMRNRDFVEGVIQRIVGGQNGFLYDLLTTLLQIGRFMFYEDSFPTVLYISNLFLVLILYMDLFALRADTNVVVRKVVKRCIYGALYLAYMGRMFKTATIVLFHLSFPGLVIPLIPAAIGAYIMAFCSEDSPQYGLIPNWNNWKVELHLE